MPSLGISARVPRVLTGAQLRYRMRAVAECRVRRVALRLMAVTLVASLAAFAQKPPLLPEKDVAALANELSGETAKRSLEGIARFHRQRGSQGFHDAAEL